MINDGFNLWFIICIFLILDWLVIIRGPEIVVDLHDLDDDDL
jgi:hypothetical protein